MKRLVKILLGIPIVLVILILTRGMFGEAINPQVNPEYYKIASPYYNIPDTSAYKLPPLLFTVGENDPLVSPGSVREFIAKLENMGQRPIEYWEYPGQSHAFLDAGDHFEEKAIPALEVMVEFLDKIFYPG